MSYPEDETKKIKKISNKEWLNGLSSDALADFLLHYNMCELCDYKFKYERLACQKNKCKKHIRCWLRKTHHEEKEK